METTIIDKGNIHHFAKLLLQEEAKLIIEGKPLFALGLVDNGVACGALAGGPYDNVFRLTSFFVAPDYRNKGGATLLLNTLKELMLGQKELFEILTEFTIFNDEHRLIEKFFSHSGFSFAQSSESIFSVTLGDLAKNPFYSDNASEIEIHKFSSLPLACIRELDHTMRAADGAPLSVPLETAELDTDLSVAVLNGSHIDGFILFDHSFCGMLTLAYTDSGSKSGSSVFSAMLRTAYKNAKAKYSSDTKIIIQPVNSLTTALVEKLANGCDVISRTGYLRIRE